MHRGGGIAQPSDPPGGSSYTDPVLFHNGKQTKYTGYCTDVFTDAAIRFIESDTKPFFAYVAYNCPHEPYQVQDKDWEPYKGIDLGPNAFPKVGQPWAGPKLNQVQIGRAYGMMANIDYNFGRLLAKVTADTIVIFLCDNGPGGVRWNAGLRNRKGTVYEGGIKVPFFIRYKGHIEPGKKIDIPAAHIDVTPTILGLVNMPAPAGVKMDGRNLVPQLLGQLGERKERTLFWQWHRGDVPEMGRAFAARGPRYKLVQAAGVAPGKYTPKLELFDLANDPFEEKDLAPEKPEVVRDLQAQYEAWFKDVQSTRNFAGPRIHVGNEKESPTVLTRQDWRGPKTGWTPESEGHWDVLVEREGNYRATVEFETAKTDRKLTLAVGDTTGAVDIPAGKTRGMLSVRARKGDAKVEAWFDDMKRTGIKSIELEWTRD